MFFVDIIKTIITYILWAIIFIIFTILCIPLAYFPEPYRYKNRLYFVLTTIWNKLLLLASFLSIKKKGLKHIPTFPQQPSIIVMNHTSAIDIMLMEDLVRTYPHIWLTKASYLKIPLFSVLLKYMHIPVQRDDPRQAGKALLRAYKRAQDITSHLLIFPEGTRTINGKLQPFRSGFALLAKKLHRPVIPVVATGLFKIFPKKSFIIHYKADSPTLTVGKAMYIKKKESIDAFTRRVHTWFEEELAK